MGSIIGYDILCNIVCRPSYRNNYDSGSEKPENQRLQRSLSNEMPKLEFEVSEFFMFGSPLSMVLAYRKILKRTGKVFSWSILKILPKIGLIGN